METKCTNKCKGNAMRRKQNNAVECLQCVGLSFLQKEGQKPDATKRYMVIDRRKQGL